MSNYARYRDWHKWIGLILLIPMCVIATTGFLWNHEKTLGIKHEEKKMKTKPAPSSDAETGPTLMAETGAWQTHSGAIDAALAEARREWGDAIALERIELKQEDGYGTVVKVKASEDADVRPYEIVWSATQGRVIEKKGDPKAGTDWAKIVHDLHTGKFFSRKYGFLWSDSSALAIVALGLTGLVLYLIPVLKKRAKRAKAPPMVASRPAMLPMRPAPQPTTVALMTSEAAP